MCNKLDYNLINDTKKLFHLILNNHQYLFLIFMILNILDWLTGWIKAKKNKEINSYIGLYGIIKKLLYWIIIFISFIIPYTFTYFSYNILKIDLSFIKILGWLTLLNLILNETISILENLVALNVKVPTFLIKGLKIANSKFKNLEGNLKKIIKIVK